MERQVSNRYRLIEPLGEGGMGVVWRAHDEFLDRTVAIKEVRYTGVGEAKRAELNARTIREARTAGRLDHPSVIVIHDVIEEDGRPWIVMHLVPSRSLAEVVRQDGPLPPARVAAIGLAVLDALRVAHAAGVLHRDVKPENVLLAHDGRVVLTDFGIASLETDQALTATGGLVGTPAYMPPERLNGQPAGPESDLWSLGATLYAAVQGCRRSGATRGRPRSPRCCATSLSRRRWPARWPRSSTGCWSATRPAASTMPRPANCCRPPSRPRTPTSPRAAGRPGSGAAAGARPPRPPLPCRPPRPPRMTRPLRRSTPSPCTASPPGVSGGRWSPGRSCSWARSARAA
ncbi:serine/threonine protein kinase [Nonomuraea sp. NBC_01738]|uniref:serine/threonine-protein kinase n=1 Tax=Nonomuraea sp. NBC_01738 TaxID=2976003 RepID=UPI002E110A52|nr:serine/threonine protein kinase [Nonomuraea sp. NBC_01738]